MDNFSLLWTLMTFFCRVALRFGPQLSTTKRSVLAKSVYINHVSFGTHAKIGSRNGTLKAVKRDPFRVIITCPRPLRAAD
jgi:hypothetical protein